MGIINAVRDMRTMGRLLPEAEAQARRVGEEQPGPEHLVLAAAALRDGTAARACHDAVAISRTTKPSFLQGAHVVAAACQLERGTFVRALDALGVDRDALRAAALEAAARRT